jgi:Zn-dependent membrane protease YugP
MLAFIMFDPWYFLIVGPFFLLAMYAQSKVMGTFRENNQQPIRSGTSGREAAEMILRAAGLQDVRIGRVPGMLSDHYNPETREVMLSDEILEGRTPAAVAVAAHECGHALQHQQGYRPMEWRSAWSRSSTSRAGWPARC